MAQEESGKHRLSRSFPAAKSLEVPRIGLQRNDEVRLAIHILVDADGDVSLDRGQSGRALGSAGCA